MKIYAPVKDFNGWRNNVRFVNGVGETDNMIVVSWFQSHGYEIVDESHVGVVDMSQRVEMLPTAHESEPEMLENGNQPDEPDFEDMTPNELRDWMREHGYGSKIKNTRNKEKLLEILRG